MKNVNLFTTCLLAFFMLGFSTGINAQKDKSKRASPPAVAETSVNGLNVKIDYSSPGVKGRKVLGNLIPNGKIWRLGANEATTFEVNKDVMVEGQKLAAGRYALFTIQDGGDWTFIFNHEPDQWGAYKYDKSKDALRVNVSPEKSQEFVERMAFVIKETKAGNADVIFNWENIQVEFGVKIAQED